MKKTNAITREEIIDRVNRGLCPVCCETMEAKDAVFERHSDWGKTPIHSRHIKYGVTKETSNATV